jgi:hypothetical protein
MFGNTAAIREEPRRQKARLFDWQAALGRGQTGKAVLHEGRAVFCGAGSVGTAGPGGTCGRVSQLGPISAMALRTVLSSMICFWSSMPAIRAVWQIRLMRRGSPLVNSKMRWMASSVKSVLPV